MATCGIPPAGKISKKKLWKRLRVAADRSPSGVSVYSAWLSYVSGFATTGIGTLFENGAPVSLGWFGVFEQHTCVGGHVDTYTGNIHIL